jgi:NAD-dependent dihydropyrimidine dehydrogenase PreA subunit
MRTLVDVAIGLVLIALIWWLSCCGIADKRPALVYSDNCNKTCQECMNVCVSEALVVYDRLGLCNDMGERDSAEMLGDCERLCD